MSDSTDGDETDGGRPGSNGSAVEFEPGELRRKRSARVRRGVGLLVLGAAVLVVVGSVLVGYRVNPRDLVLHEAPFWLIFAGLSTSLVATVTGFALLVTRPHLDEIVSTYDARVREHTRRAKSDGREDDRESAIQSLEAAIELEREKLAYLPSPEEFVSQSGSGRTDLVEVIQDARSNVERLRTRKADLERDRDEGKSGAGASGAGGETGAGVEDRKR